MDGQLILSGYTYRQGIAQLNNAFSGICELNAWSPRVTVTAGPYTITSRDHAIFQMTPNTVTLPNVNTITRGQFFTIFNRTGGPSFNVAPSGGNQIDNSSGAIALNNKDSLTLLAGFGRWYIIARYP